MDDPHTRIKFRAFPEQVRFAAKVDGDGGEGAEGEPKVNDEVLGDGIEAGELVDSSVRYYNGYNHVHRYRKAFRPTDILAYTNKIRRGRILK